MGRKRSLRHLVCALIITLIVSVGGCGLVLRTGTLLDDTRSGNTDASVDGAGPDRDPPAGQDVGPDDLDADDGGTVVLPGDSGSNDDGPDASDDGTDTDDTAADPGSGAGDSGTDPGSDGGTSDDPTDVVPPTDTIDVPAALGPPGVLGAGVVMQVTDLRLLPQIDVPEGVIVQGLFNWAEVETSPGVFDWSRIDAYLEATDAPVCFKCYTVGGDVDPEMLGLPGYVPPPNDGTPAWLFAQPGVEAVGGTVAGVGTLPLYPVYWDDEYIARLTEMIEAFGARYDGHPRIEFIRPCGWQISSNESNLYGAAGEVLAEQLEDAGLEASAAGELPAESPYTEAVLQMMRAWRDAMPNTRLMLTTSLTDDPATFSGVINAEAFSLQFGVLNTRLNECGQAGARETFAAWKSLYAVPTGWGGITSMGSCDGSATLEQVFRQALGSAEDGLLPLSAVNYVTFDIRREPPTASDLVAIDWAAARVRP